MGPRQKSKLNALRRHGVEDSRAGRDGRVRAAMKEHGFDQMLMNEEIKVMATRGRYGAHNEPPPEIEETSPHEICVGRTSQMVVFDA